VSLGLQILAGLFLPLFPLSLALNRGLAHLGRPYQRALLIILWPQLGVLLVTQAHAPVPVWLVAWALATALLYAYRAIALRDLGLWIGFLATSAWALLWLSDSSPGLRHLEALGLSAPLVLLTLLGGGLEALVGAVSTWTGLGLASAAPRTAAVLVLGVLASIATPLSPGFFTLVATLAAEAPGAPAIAVAVALVWLLWTWSGARLIQGLVVGPGGRDRVADLSLPMAWAYGLALTTLGLGGIALAGALL
jgi:hypothetical protein